MGSRVSTSNGGSGGGGMARMPSQRLWSLRKNSISSGRLTLVLFYGALISAILSTSSGAMLAPATIIGENILRPYFSNMTDKKLLLLTRGSVIVVAAISYYFASMDQSIAGLVVASLSILLVCIVAPFVFGMFWKKASVFGAWAAIAVGGLTWLSCYIAGTALDSTIYGFIASCAAMVGGSILKPDAEILKTITDTTDEH
jgi:solute:Na+ symporter, SSS family